MRLLFPSLLACLWLGTAAAEEAVVRVELPELAAVDLERVGQLPPAVSECSGLVRSPADPDRFWTHNDSGHPPVLYPVARDGSLLGGGVPVAGARNVDWEDLAVVGPGQLLIGDIGNNENRRRDLTLYRVEEPRPGSGQPARVLQTIRFRYPEQVAFPPERKNFDAEALFWAGGQAFVLTKHRADPHTALYRIDPDEEGGVVAAERLGVFDTQGAVTAADRSEDGRLLALLTYGSVWLFRLEEPGFDYFSGAVAWTRLPLRQWEALCFDGPRRLLLGNERGELYHLDLAQLVPVGPGK